MLHSKTKSKVSNGMRGHGAISKLGSEELPGRRLLALHVEVRALSSSEREGAPPLPTWLGKFARKTLTEKNLGSSIGASRATTRGLASCAARKE